MIQVTNNACVLRHGFWLTHIMHYMRLGRSLYCAFLILLLSFFNMFWVARNYLELVAVFHVLLRSRLYVPCKIVVHVTRGVYLGDRISFGWVLFDLVVFQSVTFRVRTTTGHTRVGSVSHSSIDDWLFKLSG